VKGSSGQARPGAQHGAGQPEGWTTSGVPTRHERTTVRPLPHEFLHCDVGETKLLMVALRLVSRDVLVQRPFDISGSGLVPFNQVRVVAVHLPDQTGDPAQDLRRVNLSGQAAGRRQDLAGEPGKRLPPATGMRGSIEAGLASACMIGSSENVSEDRVLSRKCLF